MKSHRYCRVSKKNVEIEVRPFCEVCTESLTFKSGTQNTNRCSQADCSYHEEMYVRVGASPDGRKVIDAHLLKVTPFSRDLVFQERVTGEVLRKIAISEFGAVDYSENEHS